MKELTISAKLPKLDKECQVTIKVPETAKEAIEVYGDEAVVTNAIRNFIVTVQAGMRRGMEKGLDAAMLQEKIGPAKMGVATLIGGGIVDPLQAALAKAQNMTPEELAAFIKQLKAQATGAAPTA